MYGVRQGIHTYKSGTWLPKLATQPGGQDLLLGIVFVSLRLSLLRSLFSSSRRLVDIPTGERLLVSPVPGK